MSLKENYIKLSKKFGGPYTLISKGLKKGVINSIMRGGYPKINEAYEVAKTLSVTIEELLTGKKGGKAKEEIYTPKEQIYIDKLIQILREKDENKKTIIKTTLNVYTKSFKKTKHHEFILKKTKTL